MPPGNMHHTRSIAYATITLTQDAGATNPSFFIRVAISSVPNMVAVRFSLFPSSHGCMGLLFDSPAEHEAVVYFTSINLREGSLQLLRSEETQNRFFISPQCQWLAAFSATWFPDEHWYWEGIRAVFSKYGKVVEVDPVCLPPTEGVVAFDRSSLRLVLKRRSCMYLPGDAIIANPDVTEPITVFCIETLRIWRREELVDAFVWLRPYFPRPPGPGAWC